MQKESIMGTTPIPRLIIKMSIPLIISLLVNNLYNLVDSIFVSRVSEDGNLNCGAAADAHDCAGMRAGRGAERNGIQSHGRKATGGSKKDNIGGNRHGIRSVSD